MRPLALRFLFAAVGGALVNVLLMALLLLPGGHTEQLQSAMFWVIICGAFLGAVVLAIDVLFLRIAHGVEASDNGWMLIAGAIAGAIFGVLQDGFSLPGIIAGVVTGIIIGFVVLRLVR